MASEIRAQEQAAAEGPAVVTAPQRKHRGTFDALQYHDYRLMAFAQVGSGLAQQSEMLTRSWLILELTGSAVAFGLVHLCRAIGAIAVMPVAGVLADRIDRRYLLIGANLGNALFFVLLALLYLTDTIEVWHVVLSAIVAGAAMTVQNTGNQSVIPALVPPSGLMNATGLQSVINGSSRVVGPSTAGFMLEFGGVAGSYLVTAALLIIPIGLYLGMKPLRVAQRSTGESFWQSFRRGLAFAKETPPVLVVMLVGITVITFGMPFLQLMPLYVKEVLHQGPLALGILAALPGVLTIMGGLVAASLGDFKWKGRLLFLSVLSPPAAALIMSQFELFATTLFATCLFGLLSSQYQPSTQAAVMKATPDNYRGRVAALISMTNNLGSVGVLLYALAADELGIQGAYLVFGLIAGGLQVLYFSTMKSYRNLT